MSRLIDADALWMQVIHTMDYCDDILEIIEAQPSAQKTGKWIAVDSFSAFGGDEEAWMAHGNPIAYHYCSECKCPATVNEEGDELITKYCSECGARMLKGEEDECV